MVKQHFENLVPVDAEPVPWWNGWFPITDKPNDLTVSVFSRQTPPAVIARDANHLDLFVVGNDGRIWTNWWALGTNSNHWNGWFPITDNPNDRSVSVFSKQTSPAVIARDAEDLDLFVVGNDGRIWTNWCGVAEVQYVPASTRRVCQLTGDDDPEKLVHLNKTGKWGIGGTDMGIPVEHNDRLYIFLGDVPSVEGKPNPNDADPIVFTTDTSPEPNGFEIIPILKGGPDPSFKPFTYKGRKYLGTNETPTGAFSYNSRCYVFIITGNTEPVSYLTSSVDPAEDFDRHGVISDNVGKFWQITPWIVQNADWEGLPPATTGEGLLLWGNSYNQVYLAWMPLDPGQHPPTGLKYFTGPGSTWCDEEQSAVPVFSTNGGTQLSVGWIREARRWVMLYTRASPGAPYESIVCRIGTTPWSWSDEITLFNPVRDGAFTKYMHQPGKDDLNVGPPFRQPSDWGWAYAPFLLNRYTKWEKDKPVVNIYYLISVNSPYQVMLMRSQLRFANPSSEVQQEIRLPLTKSSQK